MYYELEIGGKVRGLKFNMACFEAFEKNRSEEAPVFSSTYATFYGGLIGNCKAKDLEEDFNFEDVTEWVDKLYEKKRLDDIDKVGFIWHECLKYKERFTEIKHKIRALQIPEETKTDLKKKTLTMTG